MNTTTVLLSILKKEMLLASRRKSHLINTLFFFVLTINLMPFGLGPSASLLHQVAPGVIWSVTLLTCILSINRLYQNDFEDGSLEQDLLSPVSFHAIVAIKIFSHWLIYLAPLIAISPLMGIELQMTAQEISVLVMSLLVGTPILSLIGSIGAAITVGIKSNNSLISIIVLPLYIPVIIFGSGSVMAASNGIDASSGLFFLAAILSISLVLSPMLSSLSIKTALE